MIGNLLAFVLAHTVLAVPYVVLTVSAALTRVDADLDLAAMGLGASRAEAFVRVTLPLILPGVISGAVFAFIISFDEAVVSFFLSGVHDKTLPRLMFENIELRLTPTIAAVSTLLTRCRWSRCRSCCCSPASGGGGWSKGRPAAGESAFRGTARRIRYAGETRMENRAVTRTLDPASRSARDVRPVPARPARRPTARPPPCSPDSWRRLRYEHLPAAVRDMAKRCLLDTLGVTAAASTRGIGHRSSTA